MPKKGVSNSGTNSSGNNYRSYTDGGYYYTNYNASKFLANPYFIPNYLKRESIFSGGGKSSSYYNTGSGHAFYKGTNGVSFHENANQGFRSYSYSKPSGSSTLEFLIVV